MTTLVPVFSIQRASERAHAEHGWLDAYHSFSFAEYFDPKNLAWGALRVFNDDTIAAAQRTFARFSCSNAPVLRALHDLNIDASA